MDPTKFNQPVIGAIKEALRGQLTSIASKLLSSEHSKLEDLSVEEQNLWKSFDNSAIYEFITGEPDCLPEFQFNWIEPCQLAVHLPPGVIFTHPKDFQTPPDQNKTPAQPAQPAIQPAQPVVQPAQPAAEPAQPGVQPAQPAQPSVKQQPLPAQEPIAGPSGLQQPACQHDLRLCSDLNYKELHTGIKQRCRKLQCQAKAMVTKLVSGLFSPKQPPTDPPSQNTDNPGPSS